MAALGREAEALAEARESVGLDSAQFPALSHLISLLIDREYMMEAEKGLDRLRDLSADQRQRDICDHLHARTLLRKGELDHALKLVNGQIARGRNLAASYGLLGRLRLAQAEQAPADSATARSCLGQAAEAISNCEHQSNHDPHTIAALKERLTNIAERQWSRPSSL